MDPPPFFKHTFVVSIKEYELVAHRNPSYICPSYRQGEQAKNTRRGKTDALLPKSEEKTNKKTPNTHLLQLHSCFLPAMLFAVFVCPSPHPCNITEHFSCETALQEGKHISLLKHPPPQPRAIQIQFHFLW